MTIDVMMILDYTFALLTAVINNIKESLLAVSLLFTPEWELCHPMLPSGSEIRTAGHDALVLIKHHAK